MSKNLPESGYPKAVFQELSYDADEAIPGADEFQVRLAIYTLHISILVLKVLCFFRWMEWLIRDKICSLC